MNDRGLPRYAPTLILAFHAMTKAKLNDRPAAKELLAKAQEAFKKAMKDDHGTEHDDYGENWWDRLSAEAVLAEAEGLIVAAKTVPGTSWRVRFQAGARRAAETTNSYGPRSFGSPITNPRMEVGACTTTRGGVTTRPAPGKATSPATPAPRPFDSTASKHFTGTHTRGLARKPARSPIFTAREHYNSRVRRGFHRRLDCR